jgi:hypothetical protein
MNLLPAIHITCYSYHIFYTSLWRIEPLRPLASFILLTASSQNALEVKTAENENYFPTPKLTRKLNCIKEHLHPDINWQCDLVSNVIGTFAVLNTPHCL